MLKAYFNCEQFSAAKTTFDNCASLRGNGRFSFRFTGKVRMFVTRDESVYSYERTVNDVNVHRFLEDDNFIFEDQWGRHILPLSGQFELIVLRRDEQVNNPEEAN